MPEPNTSPTTPATPAPAAAPPPTAPNPLEEALASARRAADEARAQASQWRSTAQQALAAYTSNQQAAAAPAPEPEPEVDGDVAKYVQQQMQRVLSTQAYQLQQLQQGYVNDRQYDLAYRANLEYERAKASLPDFGKFEPQIKDWLQSVPVHLRATPGAIAEGYYSVLGREYEAQLRRQAQEQSNLASTGGRSAYEAPRTVDPELAATAKSMFGVDLTDDDLKQFEEQDRRSRSFNF